MKALRITAVIGLLVSLSSFTRAAPLGTAFTYQGRLAEGSNAVNGSYDLRFILYDAAAGGSQAGPILTNSNVVVTNGLFTVSLDFGDGAFTGNARWLDISVRTNCSSSFATLAPRQALTPAPYALFSPQAGTVNSAGVSASALNTPTTPASGQVLVYSGSTLAWTNPGAAAGAWLLGGNAGTTPGTHFLGTMDNQPLELKANGTRVLRLEPADYSGNSAPNVIGGASNNAAASGVVAVTISGGAGNTVGEDAGTIGGGVFNTIQAGASSSTIGGGHENVIETNTVDSTIAGGHSNTIGIEANNGVIAGGDSNTIRPDASFSTIGGGESNTVQTAAFGSTIAGGQVNSIRSNSWHSVISGGNHNRIGPEACLSTVGGGYTNTVAELAGNSTIAGGCGNTIGVNSACSTIGGGNANTVGSNSWHSVIGGGDRNKVGSESCLSTIGGGLDNTIEKSAGSSTISGGRSNTIGFHADNSTIGGGFSNVIEDSAIYSATTGGRENTIETNAWDSTIGGGFRNTVRTGAQAATIPGGRDNEAGGEHSFAAGRQAHALHSGTFVWADNTAADFASTADHQFLIRASGGVGINTATPGYSLEVNGSAGKPGGGSWSSSSDQRLKKNIHSLAGVLEKLLALRGVSFEYAEPEKIHELPGERIGMIAQEVQTVFPDWVETGLDGYKRLTYRGFEALTVEALRELRAEKDAALRARDAELQSLKDRLAALEARLDQRGAESWVLECTNALPPTAVASWPQVPPPYQTNGGTVSVAITNNPATGNQFFRLHKP